MVNGQDSAPFTMSYFLISSVQPAKRHLYLRYIDKYRHATFHEGARFLLKLLKASWCAISNEQTGSKKAVYKQIVNLKWNGRATLPFYPLTIQRSVNQLQKARTYDTAEQRWNGRRSSEKNGRNAGDKCSNVDNVPNSRDQDVVKQLFSEGLMRIVEETIEAKLHGTYQIGRAPSISSCIALLSQSWRPPSKRASSEKGSMTKPAQSSRFKSSQMKMKWKALDELDCVI